MTACLDPHRPGLRGARAERSGSSPSVRSPSAPRSATCWPSVACSSTRSTGPRGNGCCARIAAAWGPGRSPRSELAGPGRRRGPPPSGRRHAAVAGWPNSSIDSRAGGRVRHGSRRCSTPSPRRSSAIARARGPSPTDGEGDRRAEDVATLLALAQRWEADTGGSLPEFLDTVVLTEEDAPTETAAEVLGLTLHAAKGLEFDTVVIVGAEEGLMPHYRHTAAETLAEERRLCYVGMTRAREHLIFSVARMRRLWGDVVFRPPSRFLREAGLTVAPGCRWSRRPRGSHSVMSAPNMHGAAPQPPAPQPVASRGLGPLPRRVPVRVRAAAPAADRGSTAPPARVGGPRAPRGLPAGDPPDRSASAARSGRRDRGGAPRPGPRPRRRRRPDPGGGGPGDALARPLDGAGGVRRGRGARPGRGPSGTHVEWDAPDAFIRGRLDLVTVVGPHATVLDWKSGWVSEDEEGLRVAWAPGLYAALLWAWAPRLEEVSVEYHYLRTGRVARVG